MEQINVMVNGLPGNMAETVALHVNGDSRFRLIPKSLTGPEITESVHPIGEIDVQLINPEQCEQAISDIIKAESPFISLDFTHPTAVNQNAELYCNHHLPFVMGTTGGDRQQLEVLVAQSGIPAVIAPNMAKQIVGLQAMMAYAADNFPGLFEGYSLAVEESHQNGKADTSGTAVAMVNYFNAMGTPYSVESIKKERDPRIQRDQWKIPEEHISGHAWHTYTLVSDDNTVKFAFTHNVNGRDIYAGGTLDAVLFLQEKINSGVTGKVFSMMDVLKKG
jgi:4-hydroxy-tetrahydrodipicolinate reductase